MNRKDYLLVLLAPFMPKSSIMRFQMIPNKARLALVAIGISSLTGILAYQIGFVPSGQHIELYYNYPVIVAGGLVLTILLTGLLLQFLIKKIAETKLELVDSLALAAVCSLPLVMGPLSRLFFAGYREIFDDLGLLAFSVLIMVRVNLLRPTKYSTLFCVGIVILLSTKAMAMLFKGAVIVGSVLMTTL